MTERSEAIERHMVDLDLRYNAHKFWVQAETLPPPSVKVPIYMDPSVHTFDSILDQAGEVFDQHGERNSLNIVDFLSFLRTVTTAFRDGQPVEVSNRLSAVGQSFDSARELSLITFDMDNLSDKNRKYSHLHGSIICGTFEKIMLDTISQFDGVCAAMGEENLVAVPHPQEDAYAIAEAIRQRLYQVPFNFGAGEFRQGVTAGVASFNHVSPRALDRLVAMSGAALVYGKRRGKGNVTIFGQNYYR